MINNSIYFAHSPTHSHTHSPTRTLTLTHPLTHSLTYTLTHPFTHSLAHYTHTHIRTHTHTLAHATLSETSNVSISVHSLTHSLAPMIASKCTARQKMCIVSGIFSLYNHSPLTFLSPQLKRVPVVSLTGLHKLREQLTELVIERSLVSSLEVRRE